MYFKLEIINNKGDVSLIHKMRSELTKYFLAFAEVQTAFVLYSAGIRSSLSSSWLDLTSFSGEDTPAGHTLQPEKIAR